MTATYNKQQNGDQYYDKLFFSFYYSAECSWNIDSHFVLHTSLNLAPELKGIVIGGHGWNFIPMNTIH